MNGEKPKTVQFLNKEVAAFNKAKKLHNRMLLVTIAAFIIMITADIMEAPTWLDYTTTFIAGLILLITFWAGDERNERHGRIDGVTDFLLFMLKDEKDSPTVKIAVACGHDHSAHADHKPEAKTKEPEKQHKATPKKRPIPRKSKK